MPAVQVATTSAGARLFSSSLTEDDLDNFICHACEPNTDVVVGRDLAAGLFAARDIPAGAPRPPHLADLLTLATLIYPGPYLTSYVSRLRSYISRLRSYISRLSISPGTSITFDYDTTDDDLRGDRGGFDCRCGAPTCRGQILGRLFSPRYSPKNSPKYEESESEVDSVVSANLP